MQAKTERFEMRLDQGIIDRLDEWRAREDDLPSRAEAVRRLVEAGLVRPQSPSPRISDGEKLILVMLCELYQHLKLKGEIDPKFVQAVILGGHYWALKWTLQGIFHGHEDSHIVLSEVVDVLDMWSFLEEGYTRLSKKEKDRVAAEAEPIGKHVTFVGFDGNNETEHLSIARFLIEELGRFSRFKGRDLDSHHPSIQSYRRMLSVFEPIRSTLIGGGLSASQIVQILKARAYPSKLTELPVNPEGL